MNNLTGENESILSKIRVLCVLAQIVNIIAVLVVIYYCTMDLTYLVNLFQVLVISYILIQIKAGCNTLMQNSFFSSESAVYMYRTSYACMISGIGSSILDSVIQSIQTNSIWISIHMTMIGIAVFMYVGAYIYNYGCERKQENDLTV